MKKEGTIVPTVKHNGESLSVSLELTEGILNKDGYVRILIENLNQSAEKLSLSHHFVLQHNAAPKHALVLMKNHLQKTNVNAASTKP